MTTRSWFEAELAEQPAALERLLAERSRVEEIAARVRTFDPRFVVVAGRGSSANAARYAAYLFGIRHGLAVARAQPSLWTRYAAPPSLAGALVIGISQSGQSPEIVAVLETAERQGALTLSLSNEADSPLTNAAALSLPLQAGPEHSVPATKTYTSQLLALAMLSAALAGDERAWRELAAIPAQVRRAIETSGPLDEAARRFRTDQRLVVVGRGFNYATACEVALKIKEMAYVMAEPYSPADLLHGPVAMLDPELPVLLVVPSGRVSDDVAGLLEVARERGVRTIAISDRDDLLGGVDLPLPVPGGTPEWLSPIVAAVPGQRWALALALARGADPDSPRGLSKVTITR